MSKTVEHVASAARSLRLECKLSCIGERVGEISTVTVGGRRETTPTVRL